YAVEGERVHNTFDLQLINKRPGRREFVVAVTGSVGETFVTTGPLELDSLEARKVPVHVFVPLPQFKAGLKAELTVTCREPGGDLVRLATAPLLGPSPPPR
ncbi:MAG: FixG Ig-like domain-containing protein, partial [Planctomycetota bacterium]